MSEALQLTEPMAQNEFSYRPVPPLAVISGVTAILSLSGIITEFALPLAVIGCVLSVMALRFFSRYIGEYSGQWMAKSALAVCVLVLIGGSALHAFTYVHEVPEGFRRLSFTEDISKKGFVVSKGHEDFHDDVKPLNGQKIFVKGYMYPTGQDQGLHQFLLCRDSGACCFGGQPKLTDMIHVVVKGDPRGVNYYSGLVSVAGVFKLRDLRHAGDLSPAYEVEASQVTISKKLY